MAIPPDSSPYGSQTVTGPGWPNVDEEMLAATAATYEALVAKITGSIVPQQQGQLMKLADVGEAARHGGHRGQSQDAGEHDRAGGPARVRGHLGDAVQQHPGAGAEPHQDG